MNTFARHGVREYTHDASMFATFEPVAVPPAVGEMVDNILHKYHNGVSFVDSEWKGDPFLALSKKFDAHSRHDISPVQVYECLSNEISLSDKGYRQATKGRSLGLSEKPQSIFIDCDNAFRYSLPVSSNLVVNKVNYGYRVLEELGEDEEIRPITVQRRNCKVTPLPNPRPAGTPSGHTHLVTATVRLRYVYERIRDIGLRWRERLELRTIGLPKIVNATANSLTIETTTTGTDFGDLIVEIKD